MSIADSAMAARAASMIARWGGPAQLLRGGVLRPCTAARLEYNPRASGLNLEGAEVYLVSSPLAIEPHHELDQLIKGGKRFAIVLPVQGPKPEETFMFYRLTVVYQAAYP